MRLLSCFFSRLFPVLFILLDNSVVPGQSLDAAVVGGLRLLGKEAAGDPLVMVPVVGNACAAFSVPGTVVGAGAVPLIITVLRHIGFFLSVVKIRIMLPSGRQNPSWNGERRSHPRFRRRSGNRQGRLPAVVPGDRLLLRTRLVPDDLRIVRVRKAGSLASLSSMKRRRLPGSAPFDLFARSVSFSLIIIPALETDCKKFALFCAEFVKGLRFSERLPALSRARIGRLDRSLSPRFAIPPGLCLRSGEPGALRPSRPQAFDFRCPPALTGL